MTHGARRCWHTRGRLASSRADAVSVKVLRDCAQVSESALVGGSNVRSMWASVCNRLRLALFKGLRKMDRHSSIKAAQQRGCHNGSGMHRTANPAVLERGRLATRLSARHADDFARSCWCRQKTQRWPCAGGQGPRAGPRFRAAGRWQSPAAGVPRAGLSSSRPHHHREA